MAPNTFIGRKRDIGWEHGEMIDNNRLWTKCKYCDKEMKGPGVSRLKQHIAGGFLNVEKCLKCPVPSSKAMRKHLDSQKKDNEEVMSQKAALRETLMDLIRRRHGPLDDFISDDESEDVIFPLEREHLSIAMQRSVNDVHRKETGQTETIDLRGSYRAPSSSRNVQQGDMYFVKNNDKKFKKKKDTAGKINKSLNIEDMDPSIYRNRECTQPKISNMWKSNNSFKAAKHGIGKWFIFSNISPNAAANPFYQVAIDEIAKAGVGVKGPTPYEITGPILDAEIEEIQEYVSTFKKKWEVYGVTVMCDGWTSTTKLSIINFLVYCDGKIVFHKSINASSRDKDANYIYELMDDVVEEIGEKYVVQVITDNGSAYKKAGELLMRKRKYLYWTPCAAHCIDLMLEDFADRDMVKDTVEQAKKISNFIYNHGKVLDMMRKFTGGKELLRPGITRFATNYIAIESIIEQKSNLQRMFTSEEWAKNSASKDPSGNKIHELILNPLFWKNGELICKLHAPVSRVLRMVDGEKQATMGYVYEGMRRSKLAIEAALPRSHKRYCDIIEKRLKNQMIHDIHLAAHYLNPAYHYDLELSHKQELLDALKRVVQKLEPDVNAAADAISEGKYFRDAMYGFGDSIAIRGRPKTDPAEWWFMYGIDAPNLRKVALKNLSQTASSSGCERNWNTFAQIHTKVRNRLNYQKLERLVYAHYNMRLKLRHLIKDKAKVDRDFQPIDLSNIFDEDDIMAEWLDDPGDALLDEYDDDGQPRRPNTFLATCAERLSGPPRDGASSRKGKSILLDVDVLDDDEEFDNLMSGRARKRFEDIGGEEFTPRAGDVVHDKSGCNDTTDLDNVQNTFDHQGIHFTEEQYFHHATQDEDHGSRQSKC